MKKISLLGNRSQKLASRIPLFLLRKKHVSPSRIKPCTKGDKYRVRVKKDLEDLFASAGKSLEFKIPSECHADPNSNRLAQLTGKVRRWNVEVRVFHYDLRNHIGFAIVPASRSRALSTLSKQDILQDMRIGFRDAAGQLHDGRLTFDEPFEARHAPYYAIQNGILLPDGNYQLEFDC